MSLADIKQTPLVYALFRLENERQESEKKKALKDIQNLIDRSTNEEIFLMFKKYFNLKDSINQNLNEEEKKLKEQIARFKTLNTSLTIKDCESLIKILNEKKNSPYKKDVEYTKYLIACEEYKSKTGTSPCQDKVQSIDALDSGEKIDPAETNSYNPPRVPADSEKSPVFVDEKNYKNGNVRTYHGVNSDEFMKLQENLIALIDSKYPGTVKFTKTEQGGVVTFNSKKCFIEYTKLLHEKINQSYQIFNCTSEKREKAIPEKYRLLPENNQKSYTSKR